LKNPDNFSGTPDPYAVLTLNRRSALATTKTIKENANPRWNETHYIIVTSFNDSLDIQVFDYNEFRKDKELGVASFSLENMDSVQEFLNERLEIISDGKPRGALSVDLHFFPVLEAQKLPDGTLEELPSTNTGILRYTVEQAKDLDGTKSLVGLLNPFATLMLNGKEVHQTKKLKRTNNPIWDNGSKEILITDRKSAKLGVVVKDDRDITGDQVIGDYQIKLDDMLDFMAKGQDWYNLSGAKTGRVKLMAQWKPVAMTGVASGTGGYIQPVGVIRLHFKKATDLRNFETLGKSDPYARVVLSGIERARTVTFKNNLNPEWDEVLYIPVHSPRERLQLEVMDAENMGRDRSLGLIEIFSGDFMTQGEEGEWLVHEPANREDGLRMHGKGMVKGSVSYSVAFYPCLNVADPEDEDEETKEPASGDKSLEVPGASEPGKVTPLSLEQKDTSAAPKSPTASLPPTSPTSLVSSRKSRDEKVPPKLRLSPQELLMHESGLIIFKLMEAELPKTDTRVEVFVDDMAFPSYVSSVAKSRKFQFDEYGDCFIRELEFSRLTIKICERTEKQDGSGSDDRTLARLTGNTLDTLKQCLVSARSCSPLACLYQD
jgi:Ca2+-dependent lipid-binding protein